MDGSDLSNMTDEERFALAREFASRIRDSLPRELYAGSFTLKSKIPYKAASLREVLIHRVSDLADAAIAQTADGKLVPAFVTTRSVVETTAMMYWLWKKSREFLDSRDEKKYDEFLMRGMLGSRDDTTPHQSLSVLTAVDHLDREFDGLRKMYDTLCEFTHPNWSGAMGAYSRMDEEAFTLYLGKEHASPPLAYGLGPLIGSLAICQDYYDATAELLQSINTRYEENSDSA